MTLLPYLELFIYYINIKVAKQAINVIVSIVLCYSLGCSIGQPFVKETTVLAKTFSHPKKQDPWR